jgi:hypothetical protein
MRRQPQQRNSDAVVKKIKGREKSLPLLNSMND